MNVGIALTEYMYLSSSFEIIGRTEIGRKLFGSEAGPDLWTGVTRASLRAEGQKGRYLIGYYNLEPWNDDRE